MPEPRFSSIAVALIGRELRAMQRELQAYPNESQIWETHPALPNSGGTLALHGAGNLLHFYGAVYGETGYVRDRDGEFRRRDVPRAALLDMLEEAISVVQRTCSRMTDVEWEQVYPLPVANHSLRTDEFLFHLAAHLAYHLGQMDYHRRVVTGNPRGAGALSPAELPSAVPLGA